MLMASAAYVLDLKTCGVQTVCSRSGLIQSLPATSEPATSEPATSEPATSE